MTQEEKQLLYRDLCARLPYGVICKLSAKSADVSITEKLDLGGLEHFIYGTMDVLPYLRPMSSMTYEEEVLFRCELPAIAKTDAQLVAMRMELFLKGHLDFNHLIEKGLALEALEDMYKFE